MKTGLLITTAVGLVLTTTAFAQSPSGSSTTTQPSATQSTSPSTSTRQPSNATSQQAPAATAPSGGTSGSTSTTQNQQPSTNQAQTPSQRDGSSTNSAQSPAPANQPATNSAQAPSSNTSVNASANLGAQEQTRISQSISRLNVQPLTNVNFSVAVGTVIPHSVRLQALPADVVRFVPQYRGYNFVVVRDEIVIVEPSSYRIVAVLPRSGGSRAAVTPVPAQKKVRFSNRERETIRSHVRSHRQVTTVGSSARAQVRIGDRIPDTVELQEFPRTIYRTVPTVREYRYIDMDDRSYLVEPRGRTIIEEID